MVEQLEREDSSRRKSYATVFTRTYIVKLLQKACFEPDFLKRFPDIVTPALFPEARMMDLARLAVRHAREFGRGPSQPAFEQALNALLDSDPKRDADFDSYLSLIREMEALEAIEIEDFEPRMIRLARTNAVLDAMERGLGLVDSGELDALPEMFERALRIGADRDDLGLNPFQDFEYLQSDRRANCIPTGFAQLDALTGGPAIQEVWLVLAPPKRGKSRYLVNLGANALRWGADVVYVTLELTRNEVARGFWSRLTGNALELGRGGRTINQAQQEMMNAAERLMSRHLTIKGWVQREATHSDLRRFMWSLADAGRIAPGERPLLFLLDYAALLKSEDPREREDMTIRDKYLELFRLGRDFQCPCVSPIQSKRGTFDKKEVRPDDVAGCFDLLGDVTFVQALCQTRHERQNGHMRGYIGLSRVCEADVTLYYSIDYPRWLYADTDEFNDD